VVPAPLLVRPHDGPGFTVTEPTAIRVAPDAPAVRRVGEHLAGALPLNDAGLADAGPAGAHGAHGAEIALLLTGDDADLGEEGYELTSAPESLTIRAATPAGLFRGVQTLRQLWPEPAAGRRGAEGGSIQAGRIVDRPRYPYRGVMLDVARHFFGVADIRRVIDLAALYKVNYLHLHLTDDQGWRIAIDAWPRLATYGGGTDVSGGPGGHYTKDDYRDIVAYAAAHHITVVPEVDLPGHTNAALASYPELAADGRPRERYTGVEVGFSTLTDMPRTYEFLADVFAEIAALTPGPYLHIGGDEAMSTGAEAYDRMIARAQQIVHRNGKAAIGWHEMARTDLDPSTVVQYWGVTPDAAAVVAAAGRGTSVILSPANRTYLDMKYDASSRVGQSWAGYVTVADAYGWDPGSYLTGLDPAAVLGVECPLWTETVRSIRDVEYLLLPRLPAVAERAWSPSAAGWDDFRARLAAQATRWVGLGADFYASPDVPWSASPAGEALEVEHLG
jgi:hexosaminidase